MCRWLAYSGAPLYLDELIFKPDHSLIEQSLDARTAATTTNGDGFGIGWYGTRPIPGLYRSVRPAWNDGNLRDLAAQIQSSAFLAHVRAARGASVELSNCHPFRHGPWLFVHNGVIEGFGRIKRTLIMAVQPELFPCIKGSTDSEVMFYLALTLGLKDDPLAGLARMAGFVERAGRAAGIAHPLNMSVGVTNGLRTWAVRYSSEGKTSTLFHSKSIQALRQFNPEVGLSDDARAIVSEPLSDLTSFWVEIPEATAVLVDRGEVSTHPFEPRVPDR